MIEALAPWRDFYTVLGEASATMIGLLFVAASVGSQRFRGSASPAVRMFLSSSVAHFGGTLAVSLIVLAPIRQWLLTGGLVIACGLFGLGYFGLTWRDAVRDGLSRRIDLDDKVWYAIVPALGYLAELPAGAALLLRLEAGCALLAIAAGLLLIAGIHNAWDITVWSITRPPPE